MFRACASACLGIALIGAAPAATAATMTYDFDTGIGSDFVAINSGHFTVDTVGAVHIAKPADLPPAGLEFIFGGISSTFALGGDFVATVDLTLNNLPNAGGANMLNEAVLSARSAANPNNFVSVLRFKAGSSDLIELFAAPPGAPAGLQTETATAGRLRLSRSGNTVSAFFDAAGEAGFGTEAGFEFIASDTNVTDNYILTLAAVQGANVGTRSSTALDISFDNLVVVADAIILPTGVPEPAALGMLGLWLAGLGHARRKRNLLRAAGRGPRSAAGAVLAATAWLGLPGVATAYVLNPVADTYITTHNGLAQAGVPDTRDGNHGSDSDLWLIPSIPTFPLVRFDLSSFAGHEVLGDGVLTLPVLARHPSRPAVPQTIAIHLALVAWDEGTVTWNNFGVAPGPNFGADIAAASLAQITLAANTPPEAGSILSFALPEATLQSWIDAPGANRGFMVYSADNFNQLDIIIRSREDTSGDPARLSFETDGGPVSVDVPEPAVLAILGTAIVGLGWTRRSRRRRAVA